MSVAAANTWPRNHIFPKHLEEKITPMNMMFIKVTGEADCCMFCPFTQQLENTSVALSHGFLSPLYCQLELPGHTGVLQKHSEIRFELKMCN